MPEFLSILAAIGILALLGGLFVIGYLLNKKTPKPEGCLDVSQMCKSCSVGTCAIKPKKD